MLYEIKAKFSEDILFEDEGPFVSIYQPTHRSKPDNKPDPILFKKLVSKVEDSLEEENYPKELISKLSKPLHEIRDNTLFWNDTLEGLCILATPNKCMVYILPEEFKEFALVGESFHISPLLGYYQSSDRYQILSLSRNKFNLYEGNRYSINEIELPEGTLQTIDEVLGEEVTSKYVTHGSYGGAGKSSLYHGHGDKNAEIDKDTEKFFHYVDKFVTSNISQKSKLPLILFSLKEHQGLFKKISHNPYLLNAGIRHSDNILELDQLNKEAWKIFEPIYTEKINLLINSYEQAKSNSMASKELEEIAKAAFDARIQIVMIEKDKTIPGEIDKKTGDLILDDLDAPFKNDLLSDIAQLVLKSKGQVMILPEDKMPTKRKIAAIFRYYPTLTIGEK